jgi:bacteriocin biosynthesis cyclodehydratase domain-containing protein
VTRADQEDREAARSGGHSPEVGLTTTGGRIGSRTGRPPPILDARAYRLKRSIELFSASDGSLYLLRSGTGDDFAVSQPTASDRLLLESLSAGFVSQGELLEAFRERRIRSDDITESLSLLREQGLIEDGGCEELLASEERQRYDRQLIYFSDLAAPGTRAEELQRRLARASVVILGCGGLGSWSACCLACAGIGSLVLVDDDRVETSNLNRQLLFAEGDIGQLKVEAAARSLAEHNSKLRIHAVPRRVRGTSDLADLVPAANLVLVTADWPPYELPRWVNQACLAARVPYMTAGQFLPLVRVGPMVVPGQSACLDCLERAARRDFPLYDEVAERQIEHAPPAATLGAASALVGSMLALETIHFLTGACRPATIDEAVIVDLRSLTVSRERIRQDPGCPGCGGAG